MAWRHCLASNAKRHTDRARGACSQLLGPVRLIGGIVNGTVFVDVDPDPDPDPDVAGPVRLIAGIVNGAGVGAAARTKIAKIGASAARLRQGELHTFGGEADVVSRDAEGARDNAAGSWHGE